MTIAQATMVGVDWRGTATGGLVTAAGQPMPPTPTAIEAQRANERRKKLDRAWKHYTGEIAGPFHPEPGQPDVNVTVNQISTIVNTGVDFLHGRPLILKVDPESPNADAAQKALDGCWGNPRRRATLMAKLAQNGGIFGHVFAQIVPPNAAKGRPYCRVVPLDPSQVTVETDPMDCDTVTRYTIEWNASDVYGQQIARRQVIERVDPDDDADDYDRGEDPDSTWQITNWQRQTGASASWVQVGPAETWPHPWAPIVDWQNLPLANEHWGTPDATPDLLHLNSVLNFILSNINSVTKSHGMPWPWATGIGPADTISVQPGRIIQLHSPDAKIGALEAHGDLAGMLAFAEEIRLSMDAQSRVPATATGRMKDFPRLTSGVALRIALTSLLAKTGHKQNCYGEGYCTLSTRMLALCGYGDGTEQSGVQVDSHWQDPLPTDDLQMAQASLIKQQIGFSTPTLIEELGGDPDVEMDKQAASDKKKNELFAQGAGMPPALPTVPGVPGEPGGNEPAPDEPASNGGNMPPVNHPAAIRARAAVAAAAAAVKGA